MKLKLTKEEAEAVTWAVSRVHRHTSVERKEVLERVLAKLDSAGLQPPPIVPHTCHICGKPAMHMHCESCYSPGPGSKYCKVCRERMRKG